MTRWVHHLKLKDILDVDEDDLSSPTTANAARLMHQRLEEFRLAEYPSDDDIAGISDEFHTIGFVDGDEAARIDEFNHVMNGLYDWADAEKVWIE